MHGVFVADSRGAYIALIRKDQCCGNRIDRKRGFFIVIADGRADGCDLLGRKIELVEQRERHDAAAVGVVHTVDDVADVMQASGNFRQLTGALIVTQHGQDAAGSGTAESGVRTPVLRISQCAKAPVARIDIRDHFRNAEKFIRSDVCIFRHTQNP